MGGPQWGEEGRGGGEVRGRRGGRLYSHESWNSFHGQSFTLLQHINDLMLSEMTRQLFVHGWAGPLTKMSEMINLVVTKGIDTPQPTRFVKKLEEVSMRLQRANANQWNAFVGVVSGGEEDSLASEAEDLLATTATMGMSGVGDDEGYDGDIDDEDYEPGLKRQRR